VYVEDRRSIFDLRTTTGQACLRFTSSDLAGTGIFSSMQTRI